MSRTLTDYEVFESSSDENRRLLRQEELILEITIALSEALSKQGITKAEFAKKLGKTKGFVSQILAGGRNLTLRTIADVADALDCRIRIQCENRQIREDETRISFNTYGHKVSPWYCPGQPVIFKTVPMENTEFPEEKLESLLRAAA